MKRLAVLAGLCSFFLITSCGGGGDAPPPPPPPSCTITVSDSVAGLFVDGRIRSHNNCSTYQAITNVRMNDTGSNISIDYMVHSPTGTAKAFVVLIAGGDGDAKIEGDNGVGQPATRASGNFLVRSAHLFAAKGYKVVTVDRPSDFATYTGAGGYDDYRTSINHAVDLSNIINTENSTNLPVIIAGTSRGAISAVAQSKLADAITLSSPVTSGGGTPVAEAGTVKPSSVTTDSVHVMWHVNDGCGVSKPADSQSLAAAFTPSAAISAPDRGFNADDFGVCSGNSFHGFYGMEVSAVNATSLWIDSLTFPTSKPVANSGSLTYATATSIDGEDISGFATASVGGGLTFSLPFAETSLGGTVVLNGTNVEYTAPVGGASGKTDSFVYVVSETGGGTSHNVLNIAIP